MGSSQYGQLVGLFAREAGFDAVENEVEAEFVRLLADEDVNELSGRGGDKRTCAWREARYVRARLTTSRTSSRGAKPAWPKV